MTSLGWVLVTTAFRKVGGRLTGMCYKISLGVVIISMPEFYVNLNLVPGLYVCFVLSKGVYINFFQQNQTAPSAFSSVVEKN